MTEGVVDKRNKTSMRAIGVLSLFLAVVGCGAETAGTAATIGKLQAEQAKQGKETIDSVKASLEAANNAVEESRQKQEEAANQ
jgi:hypothetical protein